LDSEACLRCARLAEVQLREGELAAVFCDGGEHAGVEPESSTLTLQRVYVETLLEPELTCVRSDVGLDEVMEKLLASGLEVLPVVDAGGRLLGLVGEADLSLDIHTHGNEYAGRARTVGDVMVPWPLAVPEHTLLTQAAAVLAYEHQHHAAVISSTGELIGVLSSSQVLRWLANADGYVL
jgi:CBS domain-containing protein